MPSFIYKAVDREGEIVEAHREADSEQALILALQDDGFTPLEVVPTSSRPFSWLTIRRTNKPILNPNEVRLFTRELATLLEAGLPLDRALTVLMNLVNEDSPLHILANEVLESVKGGAPLSDALDRQEGVFSRFYLNMVRAGEAGGGIEQVLKRLSDYLESSKELRDTVTTALVYPTILVVMSISSIFVLLTFVVPQFTEMFESAGKELPVPTQVVVGVANWLQQYWWILLTVIALLISFMKYQLSAPERKYPWDKRFLKIPLVGDLIRKLEIARMSSTLETLLANGVSLLPALGIVRETLSNLFLAEKIGVAAEQLKQGGSMSDSLIESGQFPEMAMQMVKLGEETGHLEAMLSKVASIYDKEIKVSIQRMLALLEPVLIVGMGISIAAIIVSILMAIMSVNDLAF